MELFETKLWAMLGLGLGCLLVGLLPAWFSTRGRQRWPLLLSVLICFGGGVLMATSLTHMLPEVREMLQISYKQYAEFIFCAGFFLVYIIDEMVHFFYSEPHGHQNRSAHQHNTRRRHSLTYQPQANYGSTEYQPLLPEESSPYNPSYSGVLLMQDHHSYKDEPPSQVCHVVHEEPCEHSPIGNLGLLLALSVHAVLEGLAVGLQRATAEVLLLLGAIASHKLVIGFCLGLELASSPLTSMCRHFVCIAIFSIGSVFGIGIGMIIHEIPKNMLEIVFPILQGLAAGTLLYVTVSEVLPRERARWHKHHHQRLAGILQLVFVGAGFLSMVIIKIFLESH